MENLICFFPTSGVKTFVFIPPLVAFIISFFTSMAGISGAFLLLPFQMRVLGFTSTSVTSTNFLFNVVGTPGGVYRYMKECRFAWPIALTIVAGITPGVFIGYFIRIRYLPDPRSFKFFVGIVLIFVALKLIINGVAKKLSQPAKTCNLAERVEKVSMGLIATRFDFQGSTHSYSTAGLTGLAFAVGIIGGVYGIGGGSILAPFLITFFKLPVHAIAGAVLIGTFTSSAAGVAIYSLIPINGAVSPPDWMLGILLRAGSLLGMYFGAKMQRYIPENWIKHILGIIVLFIATRYILWYILALR